MSLLLITHMLYCRVLHTQFLYYTAFCVPCSLSLKPWVIVGAHETKLVYLNWHLATTPSEPIGQGDMSQNSCVLNMVVSITKT